MAKKRKTLPKDFDTLLKKGDINELIAVFNLCEIDARGGYGKQTAIAYPECPHELAKFLIEKGLDIETPNSYHYTPLQSRAEYKIGNIKSLLELGANVTINNKNGTALHCAAQGHAVENVQILINHGAEVDAVSEYPNSYGSEGIDSTPLEFNLYYCRNIDIENTAVVSKILINAGAKKTERMKELVARIGKEFEYHRERYNKDNVEQASNALYELYRLFEVKPEPRRVLHDGNALITVKTATWEKQHNELWELLVPSSGSAQTLQGEVIRIAGRIVTELEGNGGINWDEDYKLMADSYLTLIQSGEKLTIEEIDELTKVVSEVKRKIDRNVRKLAEFGVKWVLKNPKPIGLTVTNYDR